MKDSDHMKGIFAVVLAVNNLDAAIESYKKLGFEFLERTPRAAWGLEAAQFKMGGNTKLELLAAVDLEKPTAQTVKKFLDKNGEGVYQIPVGPVHAGIIEPGHFRFSVIGETIFNLEIRMFYKHRGIEKLAEGKTPEECVGIAETISGDESVANAVAFSLAIEKVCQANIPFRAGHLRTILLEMERIYSHLGDMAGMIVDVAFPRGASRFFILREEIFRQNALLTGSRFMKGIVRPGGLKKDISNQVLTGLVDYLAAFLPRFEDALEGVLASSSVVDRLETTGIIRPELVNPLNITGPAARAGRCGSQATGATGRGAVPRYRSARSAC